MLERKKGFGPIGIVKLTKMIAKVSIIQKWYRDLVENRANRS